MNVALHLPAVMARAADSKDSSSSGNGSSSKTGSDPANGTGSLASQDVFLQLLVTQLKNQDPENPADGTQFVAQLAQFTTLDQTTQGRKDLDQIVTLLTATPASQQQSAKLATRPQFQAPVQ